jgi:hypothetical protein
VKEPAQAVPTVRVSSPAVQLAVQVQPSAAIDVPNLVVDWVQRITVPPSAGQPFPTPQFPPVVAPTSIGSSIIWVYNAVEPWVRYGFDLAAYAVGWIPYVGWLAPQITIFYNFGERIARSITYNIANWLDGNISFGQGLVNVGVDTINSFIFLANDQLAFWLPPLAPIPPLPPIFFPFSTTQATTASTTAAATEVATTKTVTTPSDATPVNDKHTGVKDEEVAEAPGAAATDAAVAEVTGKVQKKSAVDAAQGEVRSAPKETTTGSAKVWNDDKKKSDQKDGTGKKK